MSNIKYVDMENTARKNIYRLYRSFDYPYFGVSVNIDVTILLQYCKDNGISFFKAMLYLSTMAANSVKEFRYRFLDDKVIEYDIVHPSYIILTKEDAFNFCTVEFNNSFSAFYDEAVANEKKLQGNIDLDHEPDRDDLLYVTCTPWFSFTGVMHPVTLHPVDSIPRLAWGKYFDENNRKKMPFGIHANHALLDGYHTGLDYECIQSYIDSPKVHL